MTNIKQLAEKAVGGEWRTLGGGGMLKSVTMDHGKAWITFSPSFSGFGYDATDEVSRIADYIAAVNPVAILDLIARLEKAEAALKWIEGVADIGGRRIETAMDACDRIEARAAEAYAAIKSTKETGNGK